MTTQVLEQTRGVRTDVDFGFGRRALEALAQANGEPDWLFGQRLEAYRLFRETPWPEWPRTDISAIGWEMFRTGPAPAVSWAGEADFPEPLKRALLPAAERAGLLALQQGAAAYHELDSLVADKGVRFSDLNQAVREVPASVQDHFSRVVRAEEGKLESLHSAFWSGGAFVYVPANVEVHLPLHVLHWVDEPRTALLPHTLIVAERGSRVTVVEEFLSPGVAEPSLCVGATEIWLADGADVTYLALQDWADNVFHLGTQRAILNRNATLNWTLAVLGSQLTRLRTEVVLNGNGSSAGLQGLYFPDGKQHVAQNTLQHHRAVGTTSDLLYKGVLLGQSRSVYQGLIRVDPGAQRTDAYQANRNLMLSREARADSMPQLEIEADDVRCTHGATVGQMDEDELFYLMSRGLNRELAARLIVEGFFSPVLDRIPLESVQNRLRQAVERKLGLEEKG